LNSIGFSAGLAGAAGAAGAEGADGAAGAAAAGAFWAQEAKTDAIITITRIRTIVLLLFIFQPPKSNFL
jgi:hypothetical protein